MNRARFVTLVSSYLVGKIFQRVKIYSADSTYISVKFLQSSELKTEMRGRYG